MKYVFFDTSSVLKINPWFLMEPAVTVQFQIFQVMEISQDILTLTALIGSGIKGWKKLWWKQKAPVYKWSALLLPSLRPTSLFTSSGQMSCKPSQLSLLVLSQCKIAAISPAFIKEPIPFHIVWTVVSLWWSSSVHQLNHHQYNRACCFHLQIWGRWATSCWLYKCSAWSLLSVSTTCLMGHQQDPQNSQACCCASPFWQWTRHFPGALQLMHVPISLMCLLFVEGKRSYKHASDWLLHVSLSKPHQQVPLCCGINRVNTFPLHKCPCCLSSLPINVLGHLKIQYEDSPDEDPSIHLK